MVMLKRWEPFAELRRLERDVDPFWGHRFPLDRMWPAPWGWDRRLPIDLYQEADKVVVKAAIPGVKLEDLDLTVADNTLAIKVEAKSEDEVKEGRISESGAEVRYLPPFGIATRRPGGGQGRRLL